MVPSCNEVNEYDYEDASKDKPISTDSKFNINLLAEDISNDSLYDNFGSNYIEGNVSPRKFMINVDLNKGRPSNDLDELCLLFEISDASKHPGVIKSAVSYSLPKTELIPSNFDNILESELKRLEHNGDPITVKTIVECLMENIAPQINTLKIASAKKTNYRKIPVDFIQSVCKQTLKVYDFKQAVQFALASQERKAMKPSLSVDSENSGIRKLFCEICYVEEDVEQCTGKICCERLTTNFHLVLI